MKTNRIAQFIFASSLIFLMACSEKLELPDASFTIEKDTIINNIKLRIEVDTISMGRTVYFVSQNSSMFNSVYPGDSVKDNKYMIYRDYNMKKAEIVLIPVSGADTTLKMRKNQYRGLALSFGSKELEHTFTSKGLLTVTWVASNNNITESATVIKQRKIFVK